VTVYGCSLDAGLSLSWTCGEVEAEVGGDGGRDSCFACMLTSSFTGGGLWHPEADAIAAVRNDIDTNPQRIKRVLAEEPLRKEFFSSATNETKAIKAFVSSNSENALKTKPKVRTYR
jgi:hypothetical protein